MSMVQLDLVEANKLAAGANKKQVKVKNGFGSLMGSKEMVEVDYKSDSNMDYLLMKDEEERKKFESSDPKKRHISEQPYTLDNWYQHINWLNFVLVVVIPGIGLYYGLSGKVPLNFKLAVFALTYFTLGGMSITCGYHRLWSHRSHSAKAPLRLFYAFFGAASVQGSIKWWGHSHRIHHRYTDTVRDPYDARRGFWYSHMGWMLTKPNPKYRARADISDLTDDWIVRFQHRHYIILMAFMAFIFPALLTKFFFNDFKGGLVWAGLIRVFAIQQATFCINSLAHWLGDQPFDDRRTPRDNWVTALITFGEGYHNFHHEFPSDYRNAIKWYQYDPSKVAIYVTSKMGLSYNLKKFSQNAIEQGILQQKEKKLNRERAKLDWGTAVADLPAWSAKDFEENLKKNPNLIVVSGIVHDVSKYYDDHPGGETLLQASLGKDATKAFHGGVYLHSNAAHNVLANLRCAVLEDHLKQAQLFAARRGETAKDFIRK
ncbi:stearoyl-CoA 9-desaturase [Hanseniaspora vineae]